MLDRPLLLVPALALGCSNASESGAPDRTQRTRPATEASRADADANGPDSKAPAANRVIIDHEVETIDGKHVALSQYRGKALLIVNTASQCGFTPQYAGLQRLYAEYRDRGFEVLAFPSNDFGGQEPGSHEQIAQFVDSKYQVEFPMFAKVHTKGQQQSPLYKTLTQDTEEAIRGEVEWNFTKFLVDSEGKVVARFSSPVDPTSDAVREAIESVLPEA